MSNNHKDTNNCTTVGPASMPHSASRPTPTILAKKKKHLNRMYVREMEYTDINDKHGHYSGAVNVDFFPHGHGAMVYHDSTKVEGDWKNGLWRQRK